MANYIQIRAKKASDVIGAGVISYALIGSFLLYKFHINLMEYTTPIILGFVVITVSFACTKRLFYHIMMENSNLLSFSMQKEFISVSSTINEPQNEPQSEPQRFGDLEERLLNLIRQDGHVTRDEMASQMNVSLSTVKRSINKLKDNDLVEYEGSSKSGYWIIKQR